MPRAFGFCASCFRHFRQTTPNRTADHEGGKRAAAGQDDRRGRPTNRPHRAPGATPGRCDKEGPMTRGVRSALAALALGLSTTSLHAQSPAGPYGPPPVRSFGLLTSQGITPLPAAPAPPPPPANAPGVQMASD